jgi:peptidoglycan/xylan/chitin deacetylase (PgdA/CDA1 family)
VRPRTGPGTVYLTFDDGPSAYTPAVLRILTQHHATATFFELGVRRAVLPHMAATIVAQGSNIGNHTYDHRDLTHVREAEVEAEIRGGPPSRCLRPPYGATNAAVTATIHRLGFREVLWTVDTLDWTRPGVAAIVARATAPEVGSGSIILMHDGGGPREESVAALPTVITTLQARGFRLRRLPGC